MGERRVSVPRWKEYIGRNNKRCTQHQPLCLSIKGEVTELYLVPRVLCLLPQSEVCSPIQWYESGNRGETEASFAYS